MSWSVKVKNNAPDESLRQIRACSNFEDGFGRSEEQVSISTPTPRKGNLPGTLRVGADHEFGLLCADGFGLARFASTLLSASECGKKGSNRGSNSSTHIYMTSAK
jgi:hypothetical protein